VASREEGFDQIRATRSTDGGSSVAAGFSINEDRVEINATTAAATQASSGRRLLKGTPNISDLPQKTWLSIPRYDLLAEMICVILPLVNHTFHAICHETDTFVDQSRASHRPATGD